MGLLFSSAIAEYGEPNMTEEYVLVVRLCDATRAEYQALLNLVRNAGSDSDASLIEDAKRLTVLRMAGLVR